MMLNLMYITNRPEIARIAEEAGMNWIFVDMEFIGKDIRQKGLDTVQNHHTVADVANIKAAVQKAKVIVRINPIHEAIDGYFSSEDEINATIEAGADIIMLPFFKTVEEVRKFIGLNDLHLALGMKFMFELLADGTVDRLAEKIKAKGIPFGFGGIATLTGGDMPGSMVLKEHYRLGSSMVIVSRSFCNTDKITDLNEVKEIFNNGIADIRRLEKEAADAANYFTSNRTAVIGSVHNIVAKK